MIVRGWRYGLAALVVGSAVVAGLAMRQPDPHPTPVDAASGPSRTAASGTQRRPRPVAARPECHLGVAVAGTQVDVSARVEGTIEEVAVAVGDVVEAGQVLARLDTEMARHELASERASWAEADADERIATLRAEQAANSHRRKASMTGLLSAEQIEEASYELDRTRLGVDAAGARVRRAAARIGELEEMLSRSHVRAPFDGVVAAVYAERGATVARGTPLVRLVGAEERLRFAVPPAHAAVVRRGERVRVWDELGHETTATVSALAPEIDSESQMVFAEATLGPGERLPIGAIVRVATGPVQAPCGGGP